LATFHFGDVEYDHVIGDPDCTECWTTPAPSHECDQSGCLEHTQFGDENADCEYWLYRMGDLCKES